MRRKEKSVTFLGRVAEYTSEGMYAFDTVQKIMMCRHCNVRVSWDRKSTVDSHCGSACHKKAKEKVAQKRQASVSDSFKSAKKAKDDREAFIKSTVNAFLKANIPLHKLDHTSIREWLCEHIPGGGDLPNARWIREHYVPQIKKDYDEKLKETLKGKKMAVLCDETTNKKGEAALIVLFKILPTEENMEPKLVVAGVKILSACNGDLTCKALLQVIQDFEVEYDNVAALVSDSAPYMNVCFRLLRELGMPDLIHIQCWAHKLDKLAKVFSDKLPRLNECVSKTKKLFKNTRKRKHKYLKYLRDTYSFSNAKEPKHFPLPVMSRWGSWKKSTDYLSEYVEDVVAYAKTIPQSESVRSVEYFKKLSKEDVDIIKAEAVFVLEYCTPVSDLLVQVGASKEPLCHLLYSKLNDVKNVFTIIKNSSDVQTALYKKSKSSLQTLPNIKMKNLEDRIRNVCKKCDEVLSQYIASDPANGLFKGAQTVFDPSKIVSECYSNSMVEETKTSLPFLTTIPTANFMVGYGLLADSVKDIVKSNSKVDKNEAVWNALCGLRVNHSKFAAMCMQVLHLPVSNVDCERGFSSYSDILSARRTKLLPENVEVMMCLYFGDDVGNNNDPEVPNCNEKELSENLNVDDPDDPTFLI